MRRAIRAWYYGFKRGGGVEKFLSPRKPTEASHGRRYGAVTGPFSSEKAMDKMYGFWWQAGPHTVRRGGKVVPATNPHAGRNGIKTLRQWIMAKYGRGVVTDIRKLPRKAQASLRAAFKADVARGQVPRQNAPRRWHWEWHQPLLRRRNPGANSAKVRFAARLAASLRRLRAYLVQIETKANRGRIFGWDTVLDRTEAAILRCCPGMFRRELARIESLRRKYEGYQMPTTTAVWPASDAIDKAERALGLRTRRRC